MRCWDGGCYVVDDVQCHRRVLSVALSLPPKHGRGVVRPLPNSTSPVGRYKLRLRVNGWLGEERRKGLSSFASRPFLSGFLIAKYFLASVRLLLLEYYFCRRFGADEIGEKGFVEAMVL
jgi:hypothetical protein